MTYCEWVSTAKRLINQIQSIKKYDFIRFLGANHRYTLMIKKQRSFSSIQLNKSKYFNKKCK